MSLPRPERRSAPAAFYSDYVPRLWKELAGEVALPRWRFDVAFVVDGATFGLRYDAGTVTGAMPADPLLTIRCDGAGWRLGAIDLLASIVRRLDPRLSAVRSGLTRFSDGRASRLDPHELRSLPGTLVVVFTDDAGDSGTYRFEIGSGKGPVATVRLRDAELWPLLEARGRLTDVLRSRLVVEGDAGWLLRLAALAD